MLLLAFAAVTARNIMAKLLYVPRFDQHGAAPRYRIYQFLDNIRALGIEVTDKPLLGIDYLNQLYFKKKRSYLTIAKHYLKRAIYLAFNKHKYDLVLMDGELFPFIPYFIERLFLPKAYIIDQDDALYHNYDKHRLWLVRKLLGMKIDKVWKHCQHMIVCNDYNKQKAQAMGVNKISVLPTVVDADKYTPADAKAQGHHKDSIIIGWVGSPTTIRSLDLIKQSLSNIAKEHDIIVYIIGANTCIDGVKTVCIDWQSGWSEAQEIELTKKIDIGIMPLEDAPYQRGKGGFKLIKYMACAKPIIASPVGINVQIVDHGVNGYLAASADQWQSHLLTLIKDRQLCQKMGDAGRQKMLAQYSYQVICPKLCTIIQQEIDANC
jgi:glycosyltransferase involved in cell wall biosynthesis